MKVILQEDVANLGKTGDVLDVAPGYGRNFLLPRKLAVLADERNQHRLDHQKQQAAARQAKVLGVAQELANRINSVGVTIKRKGTADDKLFGSVTNQDIAEALATHGIQVDKRQIDLAEPLRTIAAHRVAVKIHPGVEASLKVYVIRG
jgi:large subunit ribosomal protein L9